MTETKPKTNDEVDILELFSRIWRGITKFLKSILEIILFCIVFGIRSIHWLILFGLVGASIGFLAFRGTKRIYSSEMIAQPNGFTSIEMSQYINDIHEMCKASNVMAISNAFDIIVEEAEDIHNIESFNFIDVNGDGIGDHVDYKHKYNPFDTTTKIILNRIIIRAEVLDNESFDEVKTGLLNYINKNSYLLAVNDLRKKELRILINQTDAEINKLDSLQDIEYYRNTEEGIGNKEGQIVFMNEKETQLYYVDKVSLLNQKIRYERNLELATDPITIIKDFASLQIEDNTIMTYLLRYITIFCLIGFFVLLFIRFKNKILNYISSIK